MPKDPPTDTRFLLRAERDRFGTSGLMSGLRLIAQPVHVTAEGVRNINTTGFRPHPLADFQVSALADKNETFGTATYGHAREYREVFAVDTERAAVMLKHLRALDRGMEKLEREFSYASDFQTYLARIASVLKIRQFGWLAAEGGERWSYNGNTYIWGDATHMADWVTRQLAEYRKDVAHAS